MDAPGKHLPDADATPHVEQGRAPDTAPSTPRRTKPTRPPASRAPEDPRRALVRGFTTLARRHGIGQVFEDFCELAALAISNAVDRGPGYAEREQRYLAVIKRYDDQEALAMSAQLGVLTNALAGGARDILGEVFGELEVHNKRLGQFFTPLEVCRLMASLTLGSPERAHALIAERGFITVNEPACGSGAMVIAFCEQAAECGLNYQRQVHVTAQDISPMAVHMAYVQLSLLGIPAVVILGDTIRAQVRDCFYTPMHILNRWSRKLYAAR